MTYMSEKLPHPVFRDMMRQILDNNGRILAIAP